jgi:hypothetical protein
MSSLLESVRLEMSTFRSVVKAVRRAKADSKLSFKFLPVVAVVRVPLSCRILLLLGDRLETARQLLRLDCLTLQEEDWDAKPGSTWDEHIRHDRYPCLVGCYEDFENEISVTLWAQRDPWREEAIA